MAAPNQLPDEVQANSDFLTQTEEDDVAIAIAASLETPQGVPRTHVQRLGSEWWPKTNEDWATYNRQKSAMTEAERYSKCSGVHIIRYNHCNVL